jgi:dTMP kinase
MKNHTYSGFFVAFDGPDGVGKSELIRRVKIELEKRHFDVFTTQEPTDTKLGRFTREIATTLDGESLACLVAADRYNHIKKVITPQLQNGSIVLTDRYILSTLIFQCMDGLGADFLMSINDKVIAPDLQIAVFANCDVLQSRLGERKSRTRYESDKSIKEQLRFFEAGLKTLDKHHINILKINNNGNLDYNVSVITDKISEALR